MSDGPVLVVGSTGALGLKICERIAAQGRPLRAFVRPGSAPERRKGLLELGAELVEGDIERPETLGPALAGVSQLVTTASSFPGDQRVDAIERMERHGSLNLVEAAVAAGLPGRFVYTSLRPGPADHPHQAAKLAVERRLAVSGLEHTILQPGSFTEVWFSKPLGFDLEGGTAQVFGPGTAPLSWISEDDVADYAVWALDTPAAAGASIELGGPEAISQLDAIAVWEDVFATTIERAHIPLEALEQQLREADTPTGRSVAAVMLQVAGGGETPLGDLARSAGIAGRSVRAVAERTRARGTERS